MSFKLRSSLLAAAAVLASITLGCTAADAPTAAVPQGSAAFAVGGDAPDLSVLARFTSKPQITIAWAKKWIGPQGGRLDFLGFAIEVPPGAVDKVTQFSIRLPIDPQGSEHVVAEFGPHGKQFAVPVYIEFPYANSDIAGTPGTVVWWNNGWVDIGAVVTGDGLRLRAATSHFSTYGTTGELRTGQATSGG